ncbi:helix-turn-helix domain-containing protein [Hyphococcus sp.]|uniref:helix-turn-helix domain-containing protein n=1 Tax=Hyphococcus sp. TaxID=2038636 RepID=UPI0035C6AFB1
MPKPLRSKRHKLLRALLKEARLKAGLTQEEVAVLLGYPQSYIAKIEGGERRLEVVEFIALCEVIEVEPAAVIKKILN